MEKGGGLMEKKKELTGEFEKEYKTLSELLEAVPQDCLFFKRNVEINERRTGNLHDLMIIIYRAKQKETRYSHYSDRCVAFMRVRGTGEMHLIEQERLRKELAEVLVEALDKKEFIEDYVLTLDPMELLEAYDRAIVKKGKVKGAPGCYQFHIYGLKGKPQRLMVRQ
jgi:hypothetical protein